MDINILDDFHWIVWNFAFWYFIIKVIKWFKRVYMKLIKNASDAVLQ